MDIKSNSRCQIINLKFFKNLLIIRRIEFFIVEITIFSIPILGSIKSFKEFSTPVVIEGFILFFVLYSLGDMINCLADRELDKVYKTRLSSAVYGLGVNFVRYLVIAEIVTALILAIHLSWFSGKWLLLIMVLFGMFLGIGYSIPPLHFKSRGVFHLICLWLLLFFVPMLYAAHLVKDLLDISIFWVAASYSTIEMGIILINTSEDFPEDVSLGVKTTTVALGLKRTLWIASFMVFMGGLVFVIYWFYSFHQLTSPKWVYLILFLLVGVYCYVLYNITRIAVKASIGNPQEDVIKLVKSYGFHVPIWATMVGWLGVTCGIVLVFVKSLSVNL